MKSWAHGVAALSLVLCSCKGFAAEEEGSVHFARVDAEGVVSLTLEEIRALGLESVEVREEAMPIVHTRFGRVVASPEDDQRVVAPMDGRLSFVMASLGQEVSTGDVLLRVEPWAGTGTQVSLRSHRAELRANVAGARARIAAAESDLARASQLADAGLGTAAERARAQADLASERANLASLLAQVRVLGGARGGHLELTSPSAGVVAELDSELGSFVHQGQVLARVLRSGPRFVDLELPPDESTADAYGVRVPGGELSARLVARGSLARAGMRVDRLEVQGDGAQRDEAEVLLPGRVVPVAVRHDVTGVVVPRAALLRRGVDTMVFVEISAGHYRPRRVEVLEQDEARAALGAGLSAGERVVSVGAASLLGELGFSGAAAASSDSDREDGSGTP